MNGARKLRQRARAETGTSLILALSFLALLGSSAAVMLKVDYTSFKTTESVRSIDSRLYSADGGIDYGIQALRASGSYCPDSTAGSQSLPSQTINGKTVSVTCQTLSGSTGGQPTGLTTYALIATGYNDPSGSVPNMDNGIKFHGSSTSGASPFVIGGPVFNAGGFTLQNYPPQERINGDVHQYNDAPKSYCNADKTTFQTSGTPIVTGTWSCDLAASFPVPDPAPTLIVPANTAHAPIVSGSCTIYFPGRYTSVADLNKDNQYYFASGVYYFANVGEWKMAGKVFGGQPQAPETQAITNATPCSNDAAANTLVPGAASGYGVELVLGGSSKLHVTNDDPNEIELFSRRPAVPAAEGTAGVSLYAPRVSGSNWIAWNADYTFKMDGSKPDMVFHGLVYAPDGNFKDARAVANPDAGGASLFMAGAVAQQMEIDFDGGSVGATIAAGSAPTPATARTIVVTATATGTGEAPVTETAVIVLGTSSSTPPTISSWRKN